MKKHHLPPAKPPLPPIVYPLPGQHRHFAPVFLATIPMKTPDEILELHRHRVGDLYLEGLPGA